MSVYVLLLLEKQLWPVCPRGLSARRQEHIVYIRKENVIFYFIGI